MGTLGYVRAVLWSFFGLTLYGLANLALHSLGT
jgi:hypothetical protein